MERYIVLFTHRHDVSGGFIKDDTEYKIFHNANRLKSYLRTRFMFNPWEGLSMDTPKETVKLIRVFNAINGKCAAFKVPEDALLDDLYLSIKEVRQCVSTYIDRKLKKIVD